jgi:hypothetical protein
VKKFLVLYRASVSAREQLANATPEQMQAERRTEVDDRVARLLGPRHPRLAGGSVSGSETDATGFSIVQAESEDAAAELFRDHPHLGMPGGGSSIEILELLPLPGS